MKIKSFLFNLLPDIVQDFFIWKYRLKEDNFEIEFDEYFSQRLQHKYKNLFSIIKVSTGDLVCYNDRICIFSSTDEVVDFYFKKGFNENTHKIAKIDLSHNVIKVFK